MEIFKDIEGYEGMYQISNLGNVKSLSRPRSENQQNMILKEKLLKQSITVWGYKFVRLTKQKEHKMKTIHRLVCIAFVENPHNKPFCNHIDGIKINNNASNLEWVTRQENVDHAMKLGLFDWSKAAYGENHGRSKLTEDHVRDIKTHLKNKTKTQRQLSKEYGVHNTAIHFIKTGVTWNHI